MEDLKEVKQTAMLNNPLVLDAVSAKFPGATSQQRYQERLVVQNKNGKTEFQILCDYMEGERDSKSNCAS